MDILIAGPNGVQIIPGGRNFPNGKSERIRTCWWSELGKLEGESEFMIVDTGAE